MRTFSLILALLTAALLAGCGPSKEKAALDKLTIQHNAIKQALGQYAELRQGTMYGDTAMKVGEDMLAKLASAGLGLNDIAVSPSELDALVRSAYASDARRQLALLRSGTTGPEQAQAARAEFYRAQKASSRPITAFGVTSRGVNLLVAAAFHRAEVANSGRHPATKKPPARRKTARSKR